MFVLKKLFSARESLHERRSRWDDQEKPFLDHLEDLRKMLTKMVATLSIGVIVCFIFNKQLMDIARYPITLAGLEHIDGNTLPDGIDESSWSEIKRMALALGNASPEDRSSFLAQIPDDLRAAVRATEIYGLAVTLPRDRRVPFVEGVSVDEQIRALARELVERNPRGQLRDSTQMLRMTALGPAESFMLSLKLSFYGALVLCFPLLLWFLAEFVLPGLTPRERRVLYPSVAIGFGLFLTGVFFAYFGVLPRALQFFHEYSMARGIQDDWRIGYFVTFVIQFSLVFGISFELPVVVMALVKLGILNYSSMAGSRSYAIVIIFVTAAILTPTGDAITLSMLAIPMCILYEICIWLSWFIERKEHREAEREEQEWRESRLRTDVQALPAGAAAGGDGGGSGSDGPPSDDAPSPRPANGIVSRAADVEDEHPEYRAGDPFSETDPYPRPTKPTTNAPGSEPAKNGPTEDNPDEPHPEELPDDWGHTADPYASRDDSIDPWKHRKTDHDHGNDQDQSADENGKDSDEKPPESGDDEKK